MNISQLINFFRGGLAFVFPKSPELAALEAMSVDELVAQSRSTRHIRIGNGNFAALFTYANPHAKLLVWEIKYRKNRTLAEKVGMLMYQYVQKIQAKFPENDIILVPIPSSPSRRRKRGFNQCEVLCEEIMRAHTKHIAISYENNLLIKIRETKKQASLSREERLTNMRNVFTVAKNHTVSGKIIIVIDDVITTGSTLTEASRTLYEAGARMVYGLGIAHQEKY
jgi:ComF family protein